MINNKYIRNTSKMLSFNRNGNHHHGNTLKGLSLNVSIKSHPFGVGIMAVGKIFLLKDNHFVIFIRNYGFNFLLKDNHFVIFIRN